MIRDRFIDNITYIDMFCVIALVKLSIDLNSKLQADKRQQLGIKSITILTPISAKLF